jgi:hypothetical protein
METDPAAGVGVLAAIAARLLDNGGLNFFADV